MLLIGLLIALAAAVFGAVVLAENWGGTTYTIHGFGQTLGSLTLAEIFLAGIILTAIFFVALWLASVSSIMRRRASARRRAENRAVREERESLAVERDRLAGELDAEREGRASDRPATGADREVDQRSAGDRPTERVVERPVDSDQPPTYPRDTEVYGDRVDPSNIDTAYRPRADRAVSDEEARRHTV
jgi:uncharacterized membrane protein